jgi:cytidine deaminase
MKAILFDMDGVLIDSEALMAKSGILALRDYGLDPKPEDFVPFVGQGEDRYIGGVARKYGLTYDPAMKSLAYHYYGQYVETEAAVPPDVHWVLTSVKEKGYRIAVCTSADYAKVVHNLRAIGLSEDFFDAFVTGDKIQNLKPNPEIYLTGAKLTDTRPNDCLVVEDAPSGIKAAHAGGMKAVGITSSFPEDYLVAQSHPDYIIHALEELLDIV